ncbi:conserved hypothetical protein [Thioalkalivibrio sulfidiphilus HL-EbGr7]|uniref:DUF559 domain-containing protein n=1 Tax=Thioalkalivibrio sulfidiphilus (strain HL-EbGR7) TaxID=396588 RepID=B8GV81_THISH|nr:DUF559 domain-containing protein [Thioalkalivibrio sulfidiphilus]ACL73427.1 conserved hypothetical protein [Thioalkalivibrio sulfidiphilus HL-EbGr7]
MNKSKSMAPLSLGERDRVREARRDSLLKNARLLRKQSTDAEQLLWFHLRGRRLAGYKFRRQVVIETYIVDFLCVEGRLIVEADGGQHAEQRRYDARRSAELETLGYRVIRFWNHEILADIEPVLDEIFRALRKPPSPRPSP